MWKSTQIAFIPRFWSLFLSTCPVERRWMYVIVFHIASFYREVQPFRIRSMSSSIRFLKEMSFSMSSAIFSQPCMTVV